jgi:hypothetical protein
MRKHLLLLLLILSVSLFSQDTLTGKKDKKELRKTGWSILPFPIITFDTDLGVEFGLSASTVNFGDGKIYPKYYQMMSISGSMYTKGSATFLFSFDSDHLIKGYKTLFDVAYLPDMAYDFFGYNGYEAVYNEKWRYDDSDEYRSRLFYKQKRKMLRVRTTFLKRISESNFKILFGAEFYSVKSSSIDIDRLNKGKDKDDMLPSIDSVPPLYDRYVHWGIINQSEKDGGVFSILKAGLVFDTRDSEQVPMKGIWAEATLLAAPKFMSSMNNSFLKLALYWRHYIPIIKKRLSFAYRLNYQGTIAGYTPVYAQTFTFNSVANGLYNEGLGGAKTIRGMVRNRTVGDGIVLGNFEFRWDVIDFILFKQNIGIVLSGFFDTGRVVKNVDVDDIIDNLTDEEIDYKNMGDTKTNYFNIGAEKFHNTAGAGLHIVVNHNITIAADFAKAFNAQDGTKLGVYIGSYFLF